MKNFQLAWKFTDPKYNNLPPDDLRHIEPIAADEAGELWRQYVSEDIKHLALLKDMPATSFRVDWDNQESFKNMLLEKINIKSEQKVIFFWSPSCAVQVDWGIVIKYVTDFFYPDDDNTAIVVLDTGRKLYFSEETFLS